MSKPPVEDNRPLAVAGEWLGFLKSIPGAGKAIARLVGGLGDAGAKIEQGIGEAGAAGMDIATAKAEDAAARIRGETKAREKMRAALTNAAVKQLEATPEMGERALAYWAGDLVTKQSNREAVALRALEHLKDDPPTGQQQEPEDDWLNIFSAHAEKASSEFMREHWARILSGEIRQPGSFSYATLQLMSLMNPSLAELVLSVCPWIVDGRRIFHSERFSGGIHYEELMMLQSVSFLTMNHAMFLQPNAYGLLMMQNRRGFIHVHFPVERQMQFPCSYLTFAGQELYSIITHDVQQDVGPELDSFFANHGSLRFQMMPFVENA